MPVLPLPKKGCIRRLPQHPKHGRRHPGAHAAQDILHCVSMMLHVPAFKCNDSISHLHGTTPTWQPASADAPCKGTHYWPAAHKQTAAKPAQRQMGDTGLRGACRKVLHVKTAPLDARDFSVWTAVQANQVLEPVDARPVSTSAMEPGQYIAVGSQTRHPVVSKNGWCAAV